MITLARGTDPAWVDVVRANFDTFLQDHATCERKAAATGMMFVVRYPDRTPLIDPLITHAREELKHYHDVVRLILARGLPLRSIHEDPYAVGLLEHCRHGRDDRLLDRLLVAGILEARGCERFGLLADAFGDDELGRFYRSLHHADARHQALFFDLAHRLFPGEAVEARATTLIAREGELVARLPVRAALY